MPKITKHGGATFAPDEPEPERAPFPAGSPGAVLQERGHLGPYDEEHEGTATNEPREGIEVPADGTVGELPAEGDAAEDVDTEPEDEEAGPARPPDWASKAEWVAYVEEITGEPVPAGTTKAELIEIHGG